METITLHLHFKTLPPIVTRNRHALIFVRTQDGKFVLGSKKYYPPNISRLVGGGIEQDEDPLQAAARELNEELNIEVPPTDLQGLATIIAKITHEDQEIEFTTWLYFYQLKFSGITPGSDLDSLAYLTESEYIKLIDTYKHLSEELHPILGFAWSDYGALYGPIHQIALDEYLKLSTPTPNT